MNGRHRAVRDSKSRTRVLIARRDFRNGAKLRVPEKTAALAEVSLVG